MELRKYPCSDVQVKVSQGILTKSSLCVRPAGPSLQLCTCLCGQQ